jgi:outer membrane protein assembly factor BamA
MNPPGIYPAQPELVNLPIGKTCYHVKTGERNKSKSVATRMDWDLITHDLAIAGSGFRLDDLPGAMRGTLGGRLSVNASLEARVELIRKLEATFFYDTGAVQKPVTDEGSDDFRSSVGLGLSYITPIGPISLLYGLKIKPREGESPGCFHFSIGYTF